MGASPEIISMSDSRPRSEGTYGTGVS